MRGPVSHREYPSARTYATPRFFPRPLVCRFSPTSCSPVYHLYLDVLRVRPAVLWPAVLSRFRGDAPRYCRHSICPARSALYVINSQDGWAVILMSLIATTYVIHRCEIADKCESVMMCMMVDYMMMYVLMRGDEAFTAAAAAGSDLFVIHPRTAESPICMASSLALPLCSSHPASAISVRPYLRNIRSAAVQSPACCCEPHVDIVAMPLYCALHLYYTATRQL